MEFGFAQNVVYSPRNSCFSHSAHRFWWVQAGTCSAPQERGLVSPELTARLLPFAQPQARGLPRGGRNELPAPFSACRWAFGALPQGAVSTLFSLLLSSPPHCSFFIVMRVFKHSSFQTKRERKETTIHEYGQDTFNTHVNFYQSPSWFQVMNLFLHAYACVFTCINYLIDLEFH